MKLIVHIGTAKTGTTTIQELLHKNRERLAAQGFHFLQSAGTRNNRKLAAYCVNDGRPDDFFRVHKIDSAGQKAEFRASLKAKLAKELSSLGQDIHTVIISSEQLSERLKSGVEVRRLYELLSPYFSDFKILCWLREQCDMATSLYSTSMRSGGTLGFREFLALIEGDTRYNYQMTLDRWSEVFGHGNIVVRVFDKDCFVNGDLLSDFLACVSPVLEPRLDRGIDKKNTSLSSAGQMILLTVNRLCKLLERSGLKTRELQRIIVRLMDRYFSGRGFTMSDSVYDRLYHNFRESNRRLNKKYRGSDLDLFPYRPPSGDASN